MKFQLKSYIFIQEKACENIVWEMAAMLPRPQYVKNADESNLGNKRILLVWVKCQVFILVLCFPVEFIRNYNNTSNRDLLCFIKKNLIFEHQMHEITAMGYIYSFIFDKLTHWDRVTHICVSKLTIIGSDNGLASGRRQTIIWTNDGILLIGPLRQMAVKF